MKNQFQHNKLAQWLFDVITKMAIPLTKNEVLYWILEWTWGIIMSLIGLIASLITMCFGVKPKRMCYTYYLQTRKCWGGIDLGYTFIRDTTSSGSITKHEYGHTFQNAVLGPFFIFLIAIPSAIRYWTITPINNWRKKHGKTPKAYDAIWFEDHATQFGYYAETKYYAKKDKTNE